MSLVGSKFVGSALIFILAFLVSILIIADRPDWRRLVAILQIRQRAIQSWGAAPS
jgi:hypothetical protein